jgi:Spy/CpxP family protein refolding chaperone
MNRRIIYIAAIILTIINLAALGTMVYNRWTNPLSSSMADARDQRFEQMQRELALSAEQTAEIAQSREKFIADLDSLSQQLVVARTQLAHGLLEATVDTNRVNTNLENISRLQFSAQRKVISHLLAVKSALHPDQQKKFFAIILERFSSPSDQPMPGLRSH